MVFEILLQNKESKARVNPREITECGCLECLTSDELGVGILIDFGHINYRAGLLGVAESA